MSSIQPRLRLMQEYLKENSFANISIGKSAQSYQYNKSSLMTKKNKMRNSKIQAVLNRMRMKKIQLSYNSKSNALINSR